MVSGHWGSVVVVRPCVRVPALADDGGRCSLPFRLNANGNSTSRPKRDYLRERQEAYSLGDKVNNSSALGSHVPSLNVNR